MTNSNTAANVAKIKTQERSLRLIYQEVFRSLDQSNIRLKCTPEQLDALASPDTIAFDQLIAVLKALKGSTRDDKLQMEETIFLSAPTKHNKTVHQFIDDELQKLDLNYGHLFDFVYETGWAKEGGWT